MPRLCSSRKHHTIYPKGHLLCPDILSLSLEKGSGGEGPPSVNDVDQRCVYQVQPRGMLIVIFVLASLLGVPDKYEGCSLQDVLG